MPLRVTEIEIVKALGGNELIEPVIKLLASTHVIGLRRNDGTEYTRSTCTTTHL